MTKQASSKNTSSDSFEVETRGPLSSEDFHRVQEFLKKHAEPKGTFARYLIDYSTFIEGIEERRKDVRLRITNGTPEIIIKTGEWAGTHRKEVALTLPQNEFDNAVEMMALLGFEKGVGCIRVIHKYIIDNIELALQEVPGHSAFFEAEIVVEDEKYAQKAHEDILALLTKLTLKPFSKEEWYEYVKKLNVEANEVFDTATYDPVTFRKRFPAQFGQA